MMSQPILHRDLDESFVFCQRLAKRTAKNFYYSFLTLPVDVRRDMCALYAYMRVCDDLGDDPGLSPDVRRASLIDWRASVRDALETGDATHPILPALSDVVRRRQVPQKPLLDVIDGIEMDLMPVRYKTFEELSDYCYHVAGAVGLSCIHIWGFEGAVAEEQAIKCGLAFQLTNILRDLGEDAAMGRVYLPDEDLERFGYSVENLAAGVIDDRFRRLMAFQVERARSYYRGSEPLLESVSPVGRPVLGAMRRIYGGLLDEIERQRYNVFRKRVSLPRWKKLLIVLDATVRAR